MAEGGGVTVWKQTEARAQTPPPSPRVPVVWECEQCPLGGVSVKAVSFSVETGFSTSRSGGREQYSVKFIYRAGAIVSLGGRESKGYKEEWERSVVGR